MKSLAEMNANPTRSTWSNYTLERTYAVGGMGRSFSATHSGAKFHLITVDTVVARDEQAIAAHVAAFPKSNPMRVGATFSARAACNGNGQNTGIIARGYDTDSITCKHCRGE